MTGEADPAPPRPLPRGHRPLAGPVPGAAGLLPGWAEDAPHRCLYTSDVSGVVEQYAWDRQTDEHRQVTDRPNGTLMATLSPGRRHHLVVRRHRRGRVRRLATQPFAGGPDAVAVPEVGPAYPAGLEVGRTLVAIGRSTDDGSELWLAPSAGSPAGDLPAPRPGVGRRAHPRRRAAGRLALRARRPALPGPARAADRRHHRGRPPSSRRSGTARGAACTPWSSVRCPTTGGSWSATSAAAARSC